MKILRRKCQETPKDLLRRFQGGLRNVQQIKKQVLKNCQGTAKKKAKDTKSNLQLQVERQISESSHH